MPTAPRSPSSLVAEGTLTGPVSGVLSAAGGEVFPNAATSIEDSIGRSSESVERQRRLLVEWNATRIDFPRNRCLHDLLEAQAERTPQAVAVQYEGQTLTYAELHARADQLAHHLRTLGVGPDVLVGVFTERSLEMVVGLLAVLKSGGAYVPLDPQYPRERLEFMVRDAALSVVLTERRMAHRWPAASTRLVLVDEPCSTPRDLHPAHRVTPTSLAYVIYTSGSTGTPKGVEVPHRALVNCLCHFRRELEIGPADRWLAITTLSFDIAGLELWLPLLTGARVIVATTETIKDSRRLGQVLDHERITVFQATPATWRSLRQSGWSGMAGLRLLCGGEAVDPDLADALARHGAAAWNVYGPTETTIWSTTQRLLPEQPVTIGRPIANTQVYILDDGGAPVPAGVEGELHIGGEGVARGYRNRPELTAERFVPDPFAPTPGARMYKTGDRARWRADGAIEYLGRTDDQVKIRGFRIELGEVQAALVRNPEVRAAVVLARPEPGGEKRLVAYLVRESGSAVLGDELALTLRRRLQERLPEHMVPTAYVTLDQLPLTPNGKVDRQALAALPASDITRRHPSIAPRTPQEELVRRVWTEVFGRGDLGVQDDFFELGGHSLLAMRVAARLATELQREVPVGWCFEHRTLEALAGALGRAEAPAFLPIGPVPRDRLLPISHEQERLWYVHCLDPEECTYNVPLALRLKGMLDLDALEGALATLSRRHEMLRTSLVEVAGQPLQQVHDEVRVPIEREDLRTLPVEAREARLAERLTEEARRPFDLGTLPLLRVHSFRLAEQEHALLFTAHHIICDEWSLRLLLRELEAVAMAEGDEARAALPALGVQYADYAAWQRQQDEVPEREADRRYWRDVLAEVPTRLELPADRSRPARLSGKGQTQCFTLPADLVRAVEQAGHKEGASAFATWLTLYRALLERWSGQADVVIGTPLAFRHRPELQGVFGFFLNMLPLRGQNMRELTFAQAIAEERQRVMEAFAHGQLPFTEMARLHHGRHLPGDTPLFSTSFVLLEESLTPPQWLGCQTDPVFVETNTSKFELMLSLERGADGGLRCAWEFTTDLFQPESITRLQQAFENLASQVVSRADEALWRLDTLSPEERRRVLVEWNATAVPYPRDLGVHRLFEAQAGNVPEAVAIIDGERRLSYGELDRRANWLARRLSDGGVSRGSAVALHLERSAEFVIGALAVWKAGGCYVPLPVEHPMARRRFMLEDSRAMLVLGQGDPPHGLCPASCDWLDLEQAREPRDHGPDRAHAAAADGADPAYIMYTSGSTGEPKGVVVPHRGIGRLVYGQAYVPFGPDLRTLLLAPTAFDASTFELWGPLLHGGSCVVCRERVPQLDTLESLIRDHGVNSLWLTAGLFNQIIELRPRLLSPVAHLLTGGEALSPAHVRRAHTLLPQTRIINGYGPTECTTFACTHPTTAGEDFPSGAVPIGRPIANTRVYILDERQRPVDVGSPGELYLGGDGLALGYLGRRDLTADRFIPDPFSRERGARLYRTGDRCRWTSAGVIEFLGRLDDQVKIRGFRVELGEIEEALRHHSAVRAAAVLAQPDSAGGKRLVAYVASEGGLPSSAGSLNGTLRGHLQERLPECMVPSVFVVLEQLPLTPNGKVDRKALARLDSGTQIAEGTAVPPATATEEAVARVWGELLGRRQVGVTDDFFEVGGHSLLAVRLLDRLHRGLGVLLPLSVLLAGPQVRSMAAEIDRRRQIHAEVAASRPAQFSDPPPMFLLGWYLHATGFFPEPELLYVLPFPELGKDPEQWRVEYLADRCLEALRAVRPSGPYCLGGYSLAGLVAFEMARQLRQQGEPVPLVALIDTVPPTRLARAGMRTIESVGERLALSSRAQLLAVRSWAYAHELGQEWRRFGFSAILSRLRTELPALKRRRRATGQPGVATATPASPPAPPQPATRTMQEPGLPDRGSSWRYTWAVTRFSPQPCPGKVTLMLSRSSAARAGSETAGWERWAEAIEVVPLPGNHHSVIRKHRDVLAASLARCYHAALGNPPKLETRGDAPPK